MKKIILFMVCACVNMLSAQEFVIASFNIRNPSDKGDNAWSNRISRVKHLIQKGGFDVIGLQEATDLQCRDLLSEDWTRWGVCRDDGQSKGESSSIFYRKDRFVRLRGGNFWLSETPEVPGSKSWNTFCTRLCTWAEFRLLDGSNRTFFFFNTHLDHRSEEAKINGVKLILERIQKILPEDAVCFLTGDLNAKPDEPPVRIVLTRLSDARSVSETPPTGSEATVNGFRLHRVPTDRIDYIFVSQGVRVMSYTTIREKVDGFYPSDHFPVAARIRFK